MSGITFEGLQKMRESLSKPYKPSVILHRDAQCVKCWQNIFRETPSGERIVPGGVITGGGMFAIHADCPPKDAVATYK